MTDELDLPPRYRGQLEALLRKYVPGAEVWAYGSRIRNRSHAGSDLDLVLRGPGLERLSDGYYDLLDAIEQSNIPILIQVHDWARLPESFHREIERNYVVVQEQVKQTTSEEWREVCVSDVASARIGGTPSRAVAEYWQGNVPWATAKDVANSGYRYLDKVEESISEIGLADSAATLMPEGTVIITARGTVGALAQLQRKMAFNQTCYALVPTDEIDNDFLYYALKGTLTTMRTLTYGTVFQTITRKSFNEWRIPLPPLPEQRAIVHVLGTLDDKIELNRQMNETLETMARTLFKSWFIDFDPVRAKIEGRNTGLPKDITDLFPDRMVDSELGEIPEGWEVVSLPEIIEVNPKRSLQKGIVAPYLDMANMPTKGHSPDMVRDRPFSSGMRFANGDTLLARITPCLENGKTAYVDFLKDGETGWGSTEYIVMKPILPLPGEFAYCLARSARFREFAIQNMTGTSGRQRVPAKALSQFLLPSPPELIAQSFGKIVRLLLTRVRDTAIASRTLAASRDTLLPKLISGEIRVGEAEQWLEAVT